MKYEKPEIEIIRFDTADDIVTCSGVVRPEPIHPEPPEPPHHPEPGPGPGPGPKPPAGLGHH